MTLNMGQGDQKPTLSTATLPQNTPQVIGDIVRNLRRCTQKEIRHGNVGGYILGTRVPPELVDPEVDDHRGVFGIKCRVTYDAETQLMIAQIPCNPHAVAVGDFGQEIMMQSFRKGDHSELMGIGSATFIDGNLQKEPAACFCPFTLPPGRTRKWPTLVVESGCGDLISMTKDRNALVLEKWIPGNPPQTRSRARFFACREQSVRIFRYGNGVVRTAGDPLIIRFEEVFLRPPNSPLEQDYELDKTSLISIAEDAWNMPI
ncbi:hypothetical protein P875_00117330 [Aspergillus parasiticus SU-1]|uniref:Uncharacterized protein n=1 Tax=Aspergillus parasiticus (strain ATCC 56775 / NRRL 5862 / SRRC 143 / SU-1) TaxID=1403190 RepID=A0A0F0IKJ2_ASPPU|nr:hypothetical protein P875_00117330 [Aspergillus parasiticus SU-1]